MKKSEVYEAVGHLKALYGSQWWKLLQEHVRQSQEGLVRQLLTVDASANEKKYTDHDLAREAHQYLTELLRTPQSLISKYEGMMDSPVEMQELADTDGEGE